MTAAGFDPLWDFDGAPAFDGPGLAARWNTVTSRLVLGGSDAPGPPAFMIADDRATARCLVGLLMDLRGARPDDVASLVDARLGDTGMGRRAFPAPVPAMDPEPSREFLQEWDNDTSDGGGRPPADCQAAVQREVLDRVRAPGLVGRPDDDAAELWSRWTRLACGAWYAHPAANPANR